MPRSRAVSMPLGAVLLPLAVGCTDEDTVFRDRDLFDPLPAGAADFVGYTDVSAKLTVCGNCHVGQQAQWVASPHAGAWETLQNSGHARDVCEACHTVNQLGNPTEREGGYQAVPQTRYHDVQCESCHGPGLDHVQNPDATQPLAPMSVGVDLTVGCGECHQGAHHPFVDEWEQSGHGTVLDFPAGRPECESCHTGEGALQAFGVKADYLEKEDVEEPGAHLAIVCGVCHDPHGSPEAGQLRFPVETPSIEEHLCARCHNRRTEPAPTSAQGLSPHAPEAALLIGEAGWFPPGAVIQPGRILGTHGSEANPKLCATCHVQTFTVEDRITGEFLLESTGHLFTAIPCVDAQGIPRTGECELSTTARRFAGCAGEDGMSCHGEAANALSALIAATGRLRDRAEELEALLLQVDPGLASAGGEINPTDPTFTVAEGAYFNLLLARHGGSDSSDPLLLYAPAATHNPFLIEALLRASRDEVRRAYGL